jgi:hypothetical protein
MHVSMHAKCIIVWKCCQQLTLQDVAKTGQSSDPGESGDELDVLGELS